MINIDIDIYHRPTTAYSADQATVPIYKAFINPQLLKRYIFCRLASVLIGQIVNMGVLLFELKIYYLIMTTEKKNSEHDRHNDQMQ